MHSTVDYSKQHNSTEANDIEAIKDVLSWLGEDKFALTVGYLRACITSADFRKVFFAISIAGISGYPVHALGRIYCDNAYRSWLADSRTPE